MRLTRFERRQLVHTRAVRWVPRSSMRTACRFGSHRRLVLFIAWLTLLPAIGPLPHTSHRLAITEEVYHALPLVARRHRTPAGRAVCSRNRRTVTRCERRRVCGSAADRDRCYGRRRRARR